ncbi:MAG: diguanylate cyclase [Desulfobacterales bacterium]|nr:MAG: diguanylate cyclase [Desulfobacterales bacterium]
MPPKPTYEELEKRVEVLEKIAAEHHREAKRVRQAEETARALLNAAPDAAILFDAVGTILAINEVAVDQLGRQNSKLIRSNLFRLFPPIVAQRMQRLSEEVIRTGDPIQYEEEIDDSIFFNILYPLFDQPGIVAEIAFFSRDITEQRRTERALRESEEKFRNISASAQDALIMMDSDGKIAYWNEAAERIFGFRAEEALGKDLHRFLAPPRYLAAYEREFNGFKTRGLGDAIGKTMEMSALRKDGTEFPMELSLSALKLQNQWHAVGIVRDISDRKQAEQALRESERKYRELSITDGLTRLFNSRHFFNQLKTEMERAHRYGRPLSLIMMDIDDFKKFNDQFGHFEGDQVLARTGKVIRESLRGADSGYRYGGEEFTVILPETDREKGFHVAERIRKSLEMETFSPAAATSLHIKASIGVVQLHPGEKCSDFIKRADKNLYTAKHQGKNRTVCSD